MVAPFKLFQLPEVVLKKTLDLMDLIDVFEMSMCSKSSRDVVKRVKVNVFAFSICQNEFEYIVTVFKNELRPYNLFFSLEPPSRLPVGHFKLGCGHVIHYTRKVEHRGYHCRKFHFETDARLLLEYMSDFFHCDTIKIKVNTGRISELRSIITLPIFRRCSTLNLWGLGECPDGVEYLFKALKKVDSLVINTDLYKLAIYRKEIFQVDHFESLESFIPSHRWITHGDLMSMNCETMLLSGYHNLTAVNLNDFIKKWIKSNDESLRVRQLEIVAPSGSNDYDEDEFLKDISFKTWDPKRRPQFFACRNTLQRIDEEMDLKNGKDIVRNSDARIATVDLIDNKFCFFVWPVTY